MYRIVLCEDDVHDQQHLEDLINKIFGNFQKPYALTKFSNAKSFLNELKPYTHDIAIFDVKMDKIDGIEAARQLRAVDKSIVIFFTTSCTSRVFQSFSVDPIQYLLKPISIDPLREALQRALERVDNTKKKKFLFSFGGTTYSLPADQVIYFESRGRIVDAITIQCKNCFYGKLSTLEKDPLALHYIRCHQSYLVNPAYISRIDKNTLLLTTGEQLPISKGKVEKVKSAFTDYITELMT